MRVFLWLLISITCLSGIHGDVQLVQSDPVLVKPGASHTLSCTASGFTFSDYWMNWVRQAPKGGLQWVSTISSDGGSKYYEDSVTGRFTISRDNNKNTVYLQMTSLKTEDTAVYYCARDTVKNYAFEYWGPGTLVTVTSASEKTPSLFPLISFDQSQDPVIVGCLAKDFLPESITFSWSDKSNNSITSGFKNYKPVANPASGDEYYFTASSQYSLKRDEWDTQKPFYCTATHKTGSKTLSLNGAIEIQKKSPVVSIHPPLKDSPDHNGSLSIVCLITGFSPGKIEVQWLKNGKDIKDYMAENPVSDGDGSFMVASYIFVPRRDWDSDNEYSCAVTHPSTAFNEMKNISKSQVYDVQPTTPINVKTIAPTFEALFVTKKATLSCVVSNMSSTKDLSISWHSSGNPEKKLDTVIEDEIYENGAYSVTATADVCAEEWETGTFVCKVKHPDLASLKEVRLSKETEYPTIPPAVYLFPPHQEELNLKEKATLTCFATGFSPRDVFIKWLQNDKPLDKSMYVTTNPVEQTSANGKKTYFIYSKLNVNVSDWNSGTPYSCMVGHEALPLELMQRSIDRLSVCMLYRDEDEEIDSLWTTTSTFIVLFLLTLFYSATVTLFKDIMEESESVLYSLLPSCTQDNENKQDVVVGCLLKNSVTMKLNLKLAGNQKEEFKKKSYKAMSGKYLLQTALWIIPSTEWESKSYTCEANSNTFHLQTELKKQCTSNAPLNPNIEIFLSSCDDSPKVTKVSLVCLVSNFRPGVASLVWLKHGKTISNTGFNPVKDTNGTFSGRSIFSVSRESWNKEEEYTCQVIHQEKSFEQSISKCTACQSISMYPVVKVVRPSLQDLLNGNGKIICSVLGVYVDAKEIFLKINRNKNDKKGNIDTNARNTVSFDVNHKEWQSITTVACVVKQPCSTEYIESEITVGEMKPPQIHILHPFQEGSNAENLTLLCLVKGFYPQDIFVIWEVYTNTSTQKYSPVSDEITCDHEKKQCSTTSQLPILKTDWIGGTIYSCLVAHISSEHYRKNVSIPVEKHEQSSFTPEIYIIKPSFRDLFIHKNGNVSCRTNNASATIQWIADGKQLTQEAIVELTTHNSITWLKSTISISLDEWNKTSNLTCHIGTFQGVVNQSSIIWTHTSDEMKPPTVLILSLTPKHIQTETVTLTCVATGFYPKDLFVEWEATGLSIEQNVSDPGEITCDHKLKQCSFVSHLSIPENTWLKGITCMCKVAHISSKEYIIRNYSIYNDQCPVYVTPVYHDDEGEDIIDAEENSVWTTTSTFIGLFLLTLVYSSFVTFVKVK
ncbi:uncharacterized protein LOC128504467 [Spea bombifrons]|uniref:uncharacterized protein LOC128504467 n=1 Tax=Spea bombifrons TaxID=233779 RepID=UPI00234A264E|nr:uncharacterized protein LOC128504467 [Spea bombifrons]